MSAEAARIEIVAAEERDPRLLELLVPMAPGGVVSRYDWLYRDNPHGRGLAWLALDAEGTAMGCTSIFPRRVSVEGRIRHGSIGGDCYVPPQYRRRGVATALHRAVVAGMGSAGVDFMYGPPRPANLQALLKAGSRLVAWLDRWTRPLTPAALEGGSKRAAGSWVARQAVRAGLVAVDLLSRRIRRAELEPVSTFGEEFDALDRRARAGHRVVMVRDPAYLAWRYLRAPARRQRPMAVRIGGELVGLVVLETSGGRATLVDVFTVPRPAVIDATLAAVIDWARAAGATMLQVSLIRRSVTARRLRRFGFLAREKHGFQVALPEGDPDAAVLTDARAWYFTLGDQDVDAELDVPPPA